MAERVLQHITTIPGGTPQSAPVTDDLGFTDWDVEHITLRVPPGPAGNLGFYLANNGQPWVPRALREWLILDDMKVEIDPTGYPTGTGWQITGYNTGAYDHTVIALFHVNPVATPGERAPNLPALTFIEREVRLPPWVVL